MMTKSTRREMNRLRAEITDGLNEYIEDRDREVRIRRCGTVVRDVPASWLGFLVRVADPNAIFMPTLRFGWRLHEPRPLLH